MVRKCEKCGLDTYECGGETARIVMAGGVTAHLCEMCQTEWHRFIKGHYAFMRYHMAKNEFDVEAKLRFSDYLFDKMIDAEKKLHNVGLDWLGRSGERWE